MPLINKTPTDYMMAASGSMNDTLNALSELMGALQDKLHGYNQYPATLKKPIAITRKNIDDIRDIIALVGDAKDKLDKTVIKRRL